MSENSYPNIFFFPGFGCEVLDLDGSPKFLKFDNSVSLVKNVASSVSELILKKTPMTKDKNVQNISKQIFEIWEKSGGRSFKEYSISKEKFVPRISSLQFKENHLSDIRKNIDWGEIEKFLQKRNLHISRRKENPLRKDSEYPVFIYEIKDNKGSVVSEGKSFSEKQAKNSAMAEAVERILSRIPSKNKNFMLSSQNQIFGKNSKIYFESGPRDVFSENLITEWMPAYNFSRKKWSWMPVEIAYMDYVPKPGIKAFCLHHTMGLASGKTFEEASANGLLEIIERDAYWNVMRCRINCPDISEKPLSVRSKKIIQCLKKQNFKIVLKDISLDWPVYVIHATLVDEEESIPAFSHGTGCAFSLQDAAEKAIIECIQVYSGLAEIAKHEWNKVISVEGIIGNNRLAWLDPLIRPHINHLIEKNTDSERNSKKKAEDIVSLVKMLKRKGHEVLSSKLNHAKGLAVVRVYMTGATHPDDRLERISRRLENNIKTHCPRGAYWDPILI